VRPRGRSAGLLRGRRRRTLHLVSAVGERMDKGLVLPSPNWLSFSYELIETHCPTRCSDWDHRGMQSQRCGQTSKARVEAQIERLAGNGHPATTLMVTPFALHSRSTCMDFKRTSREVFYKRNRLRRRIFGSRDSAILYITTIYRFVSLSLTRVRDRILSSSHPYTHSLVAIHSPEGYFAQISPITRKLEIPLSGSRHDD